MLKKRLMIALVALALVAAACSETTTTTTVEPDVPTATTEAPASGEVTSEYEVTLTEFSFGGDSLDLTPGETVRFILTNDGAVEHEFRLTNEGAVAEHLDAGHSSHGDADASEDIVVLVPAGQTRVVEMTLPADAKIDLLACLIPGHYEAGMFDSVG